MPQHDREHGCPPNCASGIFLDLGSCTQVSRWNRVARTHLFSSHQVVACSLQSMAQNVISLSVFRLAVFSMEPLLSWLQFHLVLACSSTGFWILGARTAEWMSSERNHTLLGTLYASSLNSLRVCFYVRWLRFLAVVIYVNKPLFCTEFQVPWPNQTNKYRIPQVGAPDYCNPSAGTGWCKDWGRLA